MKLKAWDIIETCYLCDWIEVNEIFEIHIINWEPVWKNHTHNLNICNLQTSDYKIINKLWNT